MSAWSGLGPAVDAFLARFGRANAAEEILHQFETGRAHVITDEWLMHWAIFAKSYGLPDRDGTIRSPLGIVDDDSDTARFFDPNSKFMSMYDGATIAGRENLADEWEGPAIATGVWLAGREADMLHDAIPHYVSADIVAEVAEFAAVMDDEPLFATDIITPCGFAVLEEPFLISDLHPETGEIADGVRQAIRAIGWHVDPDVAGWDPETDSYVRRGGITLFIYTSVGDYRDVYVTTMREHLAMDVEVPSDDWNDERYLMIVDVAPWSFGTPWRPRRTADHEPGTTIQSVGEIRRWFLAFMRLCWQENIVRARHDDMTNRPTRRRWERQRPGTNLDLQVLRLRRNVYPDAVGETGTGSPLGYRTRVRGHVRRQWFPSLGPARLPDGTMNPESHRLVWIEPHWRGPEDGELHSPMKVTSVTR